jgi:hypothetical protein
MSGLFKGRTSADRLSRPFSSCCPEPVSHLVLQPSSWHPVSAVKFVSGRSRRSQNIKSHCGRRRGIRFYQNIPSAITNLYHIPYLS